MSERRVMSNKWSYIEDKPMTPRSEHPQPKEHCGHECVCDFYISLNMKGVDCPMNDHARNRCENDTRSRPHPARPIDLGGRCEYESFCRFYPSYCEENNLRCPTKDNCVYRKESIHKMGEISKICKLCNYETDCKAHDAAIARQAREDVANEIWDASHRIYDGDLITDYGAMIRKLESLRQHSTQAGDP